MPREESVSPSQFALVLFATALLSYSVLTFEIALTRIFSVMLSYHYVFAVLSFALLGLGLGGVLLKSWSRIVPTNSIHTNAAIAALMMVGSEIAIIKLPIYELAGSGALSFWVYILFATLPFVFAGLTLAGLFQEFAKRSSILYSADLLGATLAALLVVPLLDGPGAIDAAFFAALTAAGGAVFLSLGKFQMRSPRPFTVTGMSVLTVAVGWQALQGDVHIMNNPGKDMYRMLNNPQDNAQIVESRWSSFGRTDLVRSTLPPDDMTIYVDGSAGSPMYNFNSITSDPEQKAHLTSSFGAYFPFHFLADEEKDNALIIGSGGGREVVMALLAGVDHITAVEVNPDVVRIVRDYQNFNGGIYSNHPKVTTVVAEGRNYMRSSNKKYDLIILAIPVTKSSRSVEAYALTENFMFTIESMQEYLDRLTPEGRIILVAHSGPEIYRLITLALTAFESRNISQPEGMERMYMMASGRLPTLVIRNRPFTQQEATARYELIRKLGFHKLFYLPFGEEILTSLQGTNQHLEDAGTFDPVLVRLATGEMTLRQLISASEIDISPVTDDRPFFYKFEPTLPQPFGLFTIIIAFATLALVGLTIARQPINLPMLNRLSFIRAVTASRQLKIILLIFCCLGMGFMLIEIALFQKLTLFLGEPVLTLTVLLFSLLLGTGIGSMISSVIRDRKHQALAIASFAAFIITCIYAAYVGQLFSPGLDAKFTAVVLLLPLGLVLGFPFPLSIRILKEYGLGEHVYVMWGVNGVASVLGSALTMIIGILAGFSYALGLGAVLYAVVFGLALKLAAPKPEHRVLEKPLMRPAKAKTR